MRAHRVSDLKWSWSGDIEVSDIGDLAVTASSTTDSFVQEVQTRLRSDLEDWEMVPTLGASLSDLIGEPNDQKIAEEGKTRIVSSLVRDAFCDINRISVRYVPVSRHHILYGIQISLPDMDPTKFIEFSLLFDTNENDVMFL